MKRARTIRLAVALAFLLNVIGSPMAWAQWLGDPPASAMQVAEMAPACHGDEAPGPLPCCEDGRCACVAPALFAAALTPAPNDTRPSFVVPFDTSAMPAHPLDDTLRPPIR